jgi:hypothetical protein
MRNLNTLNLGAEIVPQTPAYLGELILSGVGDSQVPGPVIPVPHPTHERRRAHLYS